VATPLARAKEPRRGVDGRHHEKMRQQHEVVEGRGRGDAEAGKRDHEELVELVVGVEDHPRQLAREEMRIVRPQVAALAIGLDRAQGLLEVRLVVDDTERVGAPEERRSEEEAEREGDLERHHETERQGRTALPPQESHPPSRPLRKYPKRTATHTSPKRRRSASHDRAACSARSGTRSAKRSAGPTRHSSSSDA